MLILSMVFLFIIALLSMIYLLSKNIVFFVSFELLKLEVLIKIWFITFKFKIKPPKKKEKAIKKFDFTKVISFDSLLITAVLKPDNLEFNLILGGVLLPVLDFILNSVDVKKASKAVFIDDFGETRIMAEGVAALNITSILWEVKRIWQKHSKTKLKG